MTAPRPAMHQAPAVDWPVPRMRAQALVLSLACVAGAAVHALWWWQSGRPATGQQGWGLIAVVCCAVASFFGWIRAASGSLNWNGLTWTWTAEGQHPVIGGLAVAVDLQRLMVLRFDTAEQGVRWLWVGHAGANVPWRAFRRALFAPVNPGAALELASVVRRSVDPSPR